MKDNFERFNERCAYIVINFNRQMDSLAGKLAGKHATLQQYEVCFNAKFPREQEGLKSRGALLFDQSKRTEWAKLRGRFQYMRIFCLGTCLFLHILGLLPDKPYNDSCFRYRVYSKKFRVIGHFRWKQYLA